MTSPFYEASHFYDDNAFHSARVVLWDGDTWLLLNNYMFPVGHTRLGRDFGPNGDVSEDEIEDVREMYQRLVLERLANIPRDVIPTLEELETSEDGPHSELSWWQ